MPSKPVPMKPTKAWAVVDTKRAKALMADTRKGPLERSFPRSLKSGEVRLARVTITEGDGWRPIETAPKDGTPMLLGAYGHNSWVGYWCGDKTDTRTGMTAWVDGSRDRDELLYTIDWPTHWMPLPAPPKARKK